ncbi:MAG TPA: cytochrome P460 family protein [Bryobacteraceae bacterium]|nr:cytochrome P460 family protein [Bryobacteraceae bacterium]
MKKLIASIGGLLVSASGVMLVGQALPGTSADRIGFPKDYQSTFKQLYAIDNTQNQQVRVIWANDIAVSVDPTQPWNFPYGSILLFEDYPTVPDVNGNPIRGKDGRFVKGSLRTVFAMKKDKGFGAEYGPIRNGEWEYVSYFPDGSFATAPANSGGCALCHLQGASAPLSNNLPALNAKNDYVFRAENYFSGGSGAVPDGVMLNYLFVPRDIHVKAGVPLTIYNTDQIVHNVVADDGSFASPLFGTGGSYTMKFDQPGEIAIHCALHSRMRGRIIVDPPDAAADAAFRYGHGGTSAVKTR